MCFQGPLVLHVCDALYRASDISRKKKQNFAGKKVIILGKIGQFCGIFAREKSKFAEKSADFARLAKKSQISKDFQGQILRKIGQFHGKFQGETSPRNNQ